MTTYVNKFTITPDKIAGGTGMVIKVVARVYDLMGGCWCAYSGPSGWSDEWVADHGDEISEEAALDLFPVMRRTDKYTTYYNP